VPAMSPRIRCSSVALVTVVPLMTISFLPRTRRFGPPEPQRSGMPLSRSPHPLSPSSGGVSGKIVEIRGTMWDTDARQEARPCLLAPCGNPRLEQPQFPEAREQARPGEAQFPPARIHERVWEVRFPPAPMPTRRSGSGSLAADVQTRRPVARARRSIPGPRHSYRRARVCVTHVSAADPHAGSMHVPAPQAGGFGAEQRSPQRAALPSPAAVEPSERSESRRSEASG
jgi:hypothetical protein